MLKDKIVLITGATSGIGEGMAEAFHKAGSYMILTGRNEKKLKELSDYFGSRNCTTFVMDMEKPDDIERAAKEILEKHPVVDILVNNAGISQRSLSEETSMEVYRKVMQVNFFGPVQLTKLIIPSMIEKKTGPYRRDLVCYRHFCYATAQRIRRKQNGIRRFS